MIKFFILLIVFFNSCSEPKVEKNVYPNNKENELSIQETNQSNSKPDKDLPPEIKPMIAEKNQSNYTRFLILNSLAENFSIIENKNGSWISHENIPMSHNPHEDENPCNTPNHIAEYNNLLFITCSLSNKIHVIDRKTLTISGSIYLEKNSSPFETIIADDTLAFTSNWISDNIVTFNPSIDFGRQPAEIIAKVNLRELVLEQDSEMTRPKPHGILFKENKLYVSIANLNQESITGGPGYFAIIKLSDNRIPVIESLIKTNGRNTISIVTGVTTETKDFLFILSAGTFEQGFKGDGIIDVFSIKSNKIIASIKINAAPFDMIIATDGIAYITNGKEGIVHVFDTINFKVINEIDIRKNPCNDHRFPKLSYASSAVVDNSNLYITEFNSNCFLIIDRKSFQITNAKLTGAGPVAMIPYED